MKKDSYCMCTKRGNKCMYHAGLERKRNSKKDRCLYCNIACGSYHHLNCPETYRLNNKLHMQITF